MRDYHKGMTWERPASGSYPTELESSKIRIQEIKNEIKTILEKSKEQPTEVAAIVYLISDIRVEGDVRQVEQCEFGQHHVLHRS